MHYFIFIVAVCFSTLTFAEELPAINIKHNSSEAKEWRLERTNFYFENDIFLHTDSQYTNGVKLANVYFIPQVDSLL